ncbi:MAG: hypothetical protein AB8E15_07875 [Bdellovibrionales bacterium]
MKILISTFLLVFSLSAYSATVGQYNYGQGGFTLYDADVINYSGLNIEGSGLLKDKILGQIEYYNLSDSGFSISLLRIGGAYRFEINPKFDFFAGAFLYSNGGDGESNSEIALEAIAKYRFNTELVGEGRIILVDGDIRLEAMADYSINKNVSVGGGLGLFDEVTAIEFFARYHYDSSFWDNTIK